MNQEVVDCADCAYAFILTCIGIRLKIKVYPVIILKLGIQGLVLKNMPSHVEQQTLDSEIL